MALEDLLKRIDAQGESEAKAILTEAEERALALRRESEAELAALSDELQKNAERRTDAERERLLSQARLKTRLGILSERQQAVEKVFAEARRRVLSLGGEQKVRLYQGLLKQAEPDGDEELLPAEKEKAFFTQDVLNALNRSLGDRGKLRLSGETAKTESGFVLRKGKRTDVLSVDTAIGRIREEMEPEVVRILFGGGYS